MCLQWCCSRRNVTEDQQTAELQGCSRARVRDEGMMSVFRQLVPCQVTQYSTYDAKLAALLRKSKINCD